MKSVSQLRSEGFRVRVRHQRKGLCDGSVMFASKHVLGATNMLHNGGSTAVDLTTPDGRTVSATAKCSDKDSFCRKTGLNIALGRALKQLEG